MASVRKREWEYKGRPRSAWIVDYIDQSGDRRQATFKTKKEADAYRAHIEVEIRNGEHVAITQTVTMAEAMDDYIKYCEARTLRNDGLSAGSVENYRRSVARCREHIGHIKMTALSSAHMQKLSDSLADNGYSGSTVQDSIFTVGQVIEHAIMRGWVRRNVMRDKKVRMPKKNRDTPIPTLDEVRRILSVIGEVKKGYVEECCYARVAMVVLAIFTGMRRGEICGLHWSNVDFEQRVIHVKHNLTDRGVLKAPKTNAGVRTVPMSAPVYAALKAIWDLDPEARGEYVVAGKGGKRIMPFTVTGYHWPRVLKAAGIKGEGKAPKYTFHSLRKVATSLFLNSGLPVHQTQKLIGHSKPSTTLEIYAKVFADDHVAQNAAANVANKFFADQDGGDQERTALETLTAPITPEGEAAELSGLLPRKKFKEQKPRKYTKPLTPSEWGVIGKRLSDGATLGQAAKEAGITKQAIWQHFKRKERAAMQQEIGKNP